MAKYRVVVDTNRCTDCGISVGRCPLHAQLLAKVLEPNAKQPSAKECMLMGVFSENLKYVKELTGRCPEKALLVEETKE
ncbi:MAG: hypothetical protein NWF04_07070 [Candidatus Bathyarchaeota archaeon]|nr:hypothetical protein [Candidatus Bathyarchaeota archaeon]